MTPYDSKTITILNPEGEEKVTLAFADDIGIPKGIGYEVEMTDQEIRDRFWLWSGDTEPEVP